MNWFLRGLQTGIRTERPPDGNDVALSRSPGLPRRTTFATTGAAAEIAQRCPTEALHEDGTVVTVSEDRCIECMRCKSQAPPVTPGGASPRVSLSPSTHYARSGQVLSQDDSVKSEAQQWRHDTQWAHAPEAHDARPLTGRFKRSIHVRVVDAGDCGSCLNELAQMNGPSYNLHRFGIFVTPTPRQADVLLVVGPVTRQMREPLRAAYDAMPEPKRVVAVGACAASGGIFGPSVMCGAGAADAVPVDLVVPGCPPPPLAIIHALRTICGQDSIRHPEQTRHPERRREAPESKGA